MKNLKKIPRLENDKEVFDFWSKHDSTEYVDWSRAQRPIFPNLRPTTKLISIRFPVADLNRVKALANRYDIPYQTFIKSIVAQVVGKRLKLSR